MLSSTNEYHDLYNDAYVNRILLHPTNRSPFRLIFNWKNEMKMAYGKLASQWMNLIKSVNQLNFCSTNSDLMMTDLTWLGLQLTDVLCSKLSHTQSDSIRLWISNCGLAISPIESWMKWMNEKVWSDRENKNPRE